MIDLYALTSPNVQKIFIMLEECGLSYKQIKLTSGPASSSSRNSSRSIRMPRCPRSSITTGQAVSPSRVFESGAILLYLAEKTGKFLPADRRDKYEAIQWLMVQLTGVGPAFGQTVHFKMMAPPGNDYSVSRYTTEMKRLYELMEKAAWRDAVSRGHGLHDCGHRDLPLDAQPRQFWREVGRTIRISRWFNKISERPAVKRALEEIGKITSVREQATEDNKRPPVRSRQVRAHDHGEIRKAAARLAAAAAA